MVPAPIRDDIWLRFILPEVERLVQRFATHKERGRKKMNAQDCEL